jgi:hypothetical protein
MNEGGTTSQQCKNERAEIPALSINGKIREMEIEQPEVAEIPALSVNGKIREMEIEQPEVAEIPALSINGETILVRIRFRFY